jgi:ABC-type branched-subunit amino acid transport system ATPase component
MSHFLECRRISKIFGGIEALTDVDLKVAPNTITGVIGPNGAGKTTLFNIISGALPPTRGEVIFKGKRISGKGPARVCRLGIARTYQLVRPFNSLSAMENVLIGIGFGRAQPIAKKDRVSEALQDSSNGGIGRQDEPRRRKLDPGGKKTPGDCESARHRAGNSAAG